MSPYFLDAPYHHRVFVELDYWTGSDAQDYPSDNVPTMTHQLYSDGSHSLVIATKMQ